MSVKRHGEGSLLARIVKRVLFIDFLKGLTLTFSYNVGRSVTMRYPDKEKWIPYPRFRGAHTLNRDENGRELCVACELCVKACPTGCITVVPEEDDTGRGIADRAPRVWQVDLVRCLFCGYCEDACPTRAVRLGRDFELACYDKSCALKTREELLLPQSVPENFEGGAIVKAKYDRSGSVLRVKPDLWKKQRDWWPKK